MRNSLEGNPGPALPLHAALLHEFAGVGRPGLLPGRPEGDPEAPPDGFDSQITSIREVNHRRGGAESSAASASSPSSRRRRYGSMAFPSSTAPHRSVLTNKEWSRNKRH